MSKSKNTYARKTKKKGFLNGITTPLETKKDLPNSLMETGKDLVIGAIGGGAAGAVMGKWSLLSGVAVTILGHYFENTLTSAFGLGMMSSGAVSTINGVNGTEDKDTIEGIKERLSLFKDSLSQRFFIDKLKQLKQPTAPANTAATAPVGEVQYFSYPDNVNGMGDAVSDREHIAMLNNLENQIASQAQMKGILPEENSIGNTMSEAPVIDLGQMGEIDFAAKNY